MNISAKIELLSPEDGPPADEQRSRREIAAFQTMAAALAEERDLESIFHLVVGTLSSLTGADRCSLHLLERDTGLFRGHAAHAARNIDVEVRQLVSGMQGDEFTREILSTREPVMVSDTTTDPRTVRAAMQKWRARSVLGVPMLLRGEVIGMVCLDTEDEPKEFSQLDQDLAVSYAEFAATAINQVELTIKLRESLHTQSRQLEMLQRARQMEGHLADILLEGNGIRQVAQTISRLLSKPCGVFDDTLRCVAVGGPPGPATTARLRESVLTDHSGARAAMDTLKSGGIATLEPQPHLGIFHRHLITPIDMSTGRYGYIVVAETGGRCGTLDEVIMRRAAHNISLERSRNQMETDLEWHLVESFTNSLLRGTASDSDPLAQSLGIDPLERRFVCLIAPRVGSIDVLPTPHVLAQILTESASPSAALAANLESALAAVVPVPHDLDSRAATAWVRRRIANVATALSPSGGLCVAISSLAVGVAGVPRSYREARQVLRCAQIHTGETGVAVVTTEDVGAARLMLASASREEALQYVRDAFGELADHRSDRSNELLSTLDTFLLRGRNVRECAEDLAVHPNTVRYRLSTIEELTDLAVVSDDTDYMTAQMAMAVLRMNAIAVTPKPDASAAN
ncbi:GAF domain-containing protein [Gordonia polyisoprenivorans]|nr:GAF domain-containing protein [Gordonia polyisoprenivorans]